MDSSIVTILGILAGMLAGFFAIAKTMLNSATKERDADRQERLKLSEAINHMARNSDKVAAATQRSADEAKQRNGHLAELVIQNTDNIVKAVTDHYDQHIQHQVVDKQTVNKRIM
jgi:hypothetical protein